MIRALFLEELSLWTWVWQSTLFVLIGLAVSFLLRRRPARACQGLFLAMVAAVLVPIMSVLVGYFGLGLFAPEPATHESEITYQIFTIDYDFSQAVLPADVQADVVPVEPAPVKAAPQGVDIPWRSVLLYGWMIAALILLGRLFVAFVGGVFLLRRANSPCCERIRRAAHSARARLGITKDFRIRSGKNVRSPMIWCWSRLPVLLVPGDLDDNVNWVDVISHELAHWRRRDHLSGLLAELVVCILPWNPFLWWAKKRVVKLSEQACDDWVLVGGRAGTDYAQSLLNLSPKVQMAFLPTMIGKEKPMKERIYRIVKEKYGDPRFGARWALAMTVIAATLTVGVAFAQRRPERFEPPDRDEWRAEEERERQRFSEHREKFESRAHELEIRISKVKRE
ncbi:M56 family metallopeptidase, partial [Planctomycetota bacterium]